VWLDTFDGDQHIGEEKLNGGEWITRAEAHRLALRMAGNCRWND